MNEEAKKEISLMLTMLKNTLMKNNISMATDADGNIVFFDTSIYLQNNKMEGFRVKIENLVK